jgi:hypothetical protein
MEQNHCLNNKNKNNFQNKVTKPICIPIKTPDSPSKQLQIDYSLHNHFFDPSKSSPPNVFLLNLEKRIKAYQSLGINESKFVNV